MKEYLLLKLKYVFLLSFFILVGCVHTSPYEDFYESYIPNPEDKISYDHWVEENKPLFLKEGELPKITSVQDIDQSLREYQSDHFIVMGVSNFSGQLQWDDDLEYLAMDLGATVVLKKSKLYALNNKGWRDLHLQWKDQFYTHQNLSSLQTGSFLSSQNQ